MHTCFVLIIISNVYLYRNCHKALYMTHNIFASQWYYVHFLPYAHTCVRVHTHTHAYGYTRTCVWKEMNLEPLPCEDESIISEGIFVFQFTQRQSTNQETWSLLSIVPSTSSSRIQVGFTIISPNLKDLFFYLKWYHFLKTVLDTRSRR